MVFRRKAAEDRFFIILYKFAKDLRYYESIVLGKLPLISMV